MKKISLILSLFTYFLVPLSLSAIDRVIIWGHKLHSHTHSYVHYGFYQAFKRMGYETLWLDNKDDISGLELSNTLFFTEHQVDQKMPLRDDCYYFVHYSDDPKYDHLKEIGRFIDLKVYKNYFITDSPTLVEVEPLIYYDVPNRTLIIPWATDLFPEEIERNKALTPLLKSPLTTKEKTIYWVGTIGGGAQGNIPELAPFRNACAKNGVKFVHSDPWGRPVSFEENQKLIRQSYLAPAICGNIQLEHDYIPCRIFKNISYGHIGGTNSEAVSKLFNNKIVYNRDTRQLYYDMEKKLQERNLDELYELMDFVKEHHTYLNRAEHLLKFIDLIEDSETRE